MSMSTVHVCEHRMGLMLNQCAIIYTDKAGASNNFWCQWEKKSITTFQQIVKLS